MEVDLSDVAICVVCGKPIDMISSSHEIVLFDYKEEIFPGEIERSDVMDSIAQYIRKNSNEQIDLDLAHSYENGDETVFHGVCYDETVLSSLSGNEEYIVNALEEIMEDK